MSNLPSVTYNDAIADRSVIRELVDCAERLPNAGALGPVIDDARRPPRLDEGHSEAERSSARIDYDITGCAMLIRMQVFDSIGLFDEGYFVYGEETDLLERMKRTCWRPYFVPTHGHVLHKGGATVSMQSGFEVYHRSRNCIVFAGKNLYGRRLTQYIVTYLTRYVPSNLIADLESEDSGRRIIKRVRGLLSGFGIFFAVRRKHRRLIH